MKYLLTNIDYKNNSKTDKLYYLKNNFKFIINKNLILDHPRGIIFKNDDEILDLVIGNIRKDNIYINESINNNINLNGYSGNFTRIYINKKSSNIYVFKNSSINENVYFYNFKKFFALSNDLKLLSQLTNSSINKKVASELYLSGSNLSNMLARNKNYVQSLFNNIYLLKTNKIFNYNYSKNILHFSERKTFFKKNKLEILSNIYDAYYNNKKIYNLSFTGGMDSRLGLSILLSKNLQKNLILHYIFEDECEKKCIIDICKKFDLTLVIIYHTINGKRLKENLMFNDQEELHDINIELDKIIENFNINSFSKFNILNRTLNSKLKFKNEYIIENVSSHHKNKGLINIQEIIKSSLSFKNSIMHSAGEFYKGLFFQRQSWPCLNKSKKNKIICFIKYACKEYNIDLQNFTVINNFYAKYLKRLTSLKEHNIEDGDSNKNFYLSSLSLYQHLTRNNRNNLDSSDYCLTPLCDDELVNFLYSDLDNNNFQYYRNEIFHYEVINHFFPKLLRYDFYGQGNLYSEELKNKFNPKNKKHLHYTYTKSKNKPINYKKLLIDNEPNIFEQIINYYKNENFKAIINESVLNSYLKEPLKYFNELSNVIVCCILTSDKYWKNNNLKKTIVLSQ